MRWAIGGLLLILLAVFAVKAAPTDKYSYRYRLQISMEVDGKVLTGSSVIEVKWACGQLIPGAGLAPCESSLGGQATVVDLGPRGVVVATLFTGENVLPVPDGAVDAVWLCANAFGNRSTYEEIPKLPGLAGRRVLAPDNFPRLVWFSNPADPNSARKVTVGNIASILDPSARITEATVEITRDPIVVDIAKKLPWYPAMLEAQKGKGITSKPGKFQLMYRMFVGDNS